MILNSLSHCPPLSNGVGKSTLAMAALWALAGTVDPRPTQDGKVSDVINDFCKVAEVSLHGSINNKQFIVTRTKSTSSQGSSLTFVLDGQVLTQQSIIGTQQLIDQNFGTGSQLLTRTMFHGQHSIGGLLESSDAKLKEELSHLISLEIWQQSASHARSSQRELLRKSTELEGMLSMRAKDKMRVEEKARAAKEEVRRRKELFEHEKHSMTKQHRLIDTQDVGIENDMESVQNQLRDCANEISSIEAEIAQIIHSGNDEMKALQDVANRNAAQESIARANLQACQRKYDLAVMELQSAGERLSNLKSDWDVSMNVKENAFPFFSTPESCRTCGQPINSSKAQEHVRESIKESLASALSIEARAKDSVSFAEQALAEAMESVDYRALEVQACTEQLRMAEEKRVLETNELRQQMKATRLVQSELSNEFTALARRAKEISENNFLQSRMQANLDKLREALNSSVAAYEDCCSEMKILDSNISDLKREKDDLTKKASHYALLAETLGPKGVQAFVLRNIVQALQYCSQAYLNELSDGSLQLRMEVGSNDSIIKRAAVRNLDGTWRVRPLSSLSGGQWRRCSLALGLGFIDLASKRGRLRSSLLVLDEPLTHLDSAGRKSVGKLLRKILSHDSQLGKTGRGGFGLSTILVILQEIAAEEIEDCFDQIDEVIKRGGESFVFVDMNQMG
jgi:DNA repair exonuclease SbcCD ATPase subunit